jgi:hypothetical protein
MALDELLKRFHPRNPKGHDIEAIITSISTFGYVAPGALDERTGWFIEGHGRTEALSVMRKQQMDCPQRIEQRNGDWYAPVVRGIAFATDHEVDAYLVADNRLTELGGWDNQALASLLQDIAANDEHLLQPTGYDGDDLDEILRELNPEFPEYDESIADTVEYHQCPECAHKWPK